MEQFLDNEEDQLIMLPVYSPQPVEPQTEVGQLPVSDQDFLVKYFQKQAEQQKNEQQAQQKMILDAQEQASKGRLLARIGQAANTIGAGLTRQKPDADFYNSLISEADRPVEQARLDQRQLQQQQQLSNSTDKLISQYFAKKQAEQQKNESFDERKKHNKVVEDYLKARAQSMTSGLGIREDAQAAKAADTIHKDTQVTQMTNQLNLMDRARGILERPSLTNQEFNDVQIELSNAIAGARSAALGKLERTEYESAQQTLADLKQRITGKPQDAVPPQILARVKSLADEVTAKLAQHRFERVENLRRPYKNNKAAESAQDEAIQKYAVPQREAQSTAPKAAPGKVRVISPDSKTGQIPESQLEDALKQGYRRQ